MMGSGDVYGQKTSAQFLGAFLEKRIMKDRPSREALRQSAVSLHTDTYSPLDQRASIW
jgi:hypothetical protein